MEFSQHNTDKHIKNVIFSVNLLIQYLISINLYYQQSHSIYYPKIIMTQLLCFYTQVIIKYKTLLPFLILFTQLMNLRHISMHKYRVNLWRLL